MQNECIYIKRVKHDEDVIFSEVFEYKYTSKIDITLFTLCHMISRAVQSPSIVLCMHQCPGETGSL